MPVEPTKLRNLIEEELCKVRDERVVHHVRRLLVQPKAEFRDWDYGVAGEKYLCWIVLDDGSGHGIAYCEEGFGPRSPWGLVSASGGDGRSSMGMDSGWYPTFMEAYFASWAAADLPIWRVFSMDSAWPGRPLTEELSWADAWKRCEDAQQGDPRSRFGVHHTISYGL